MLNEKRKSVLISEELHNKLKTKSKNSGISIKHLTEMGIKQILNRIITFEEENK